MQAAIRFVGLFAATRSARADRPAAVVERRGAAKKAIVEFVKATNMQGSSLNAAGIYYYPLQAMKPLKEMGNLSPLHN